MTILVTGSSGFVGQHLVPRLLAEGHEIICAGRRPVERPSLLRCQHFVCDWQSSSNVTSLPWPDIEAVIHLAAAGVKSVHREWPECLSVNIVGLQSLFTALDHCARPPRLITTGTFYEKLVEAHTELLENPYIATKWAAAKILQTWAGRFGGSVTGLHLFQIYGPGDSPGNILTYTKKSLATGTIARLGSGTSRRDWLHIDDAVNAICHALTLSQASGFRTYDVGTGELHSIREATERLADFMQCPRTRLDFDSTRDRPDASIAELAATDLLPGWTPRLGFLEGLKQFVMT